MLGIVRLNFVINLTHVYNRFDDDMFYICYMSTVGLTMNINTLMLQ